MSDDDFEVLEPKEYTNTKDESYSHSSLVMTALKKVRDNRSKEMRDGYYNTKFDKFGNAHKVWIPDSRQEFIESVESLKMIQERDYDDEVEQRLFEIEEWLDGKYEEYCGKEKEHWNNIDYELVKNYNQQGTYFMEGMLSERFLPFYKMYIRDKVDAYTQIVSHIQQLIKRDGDYQEETTKA